VLYQKDVFTFLKNSSKRLGETPSVTRDEDRVTEKN
jgi:hypothetical protein